MKRRKKRIEPEPSFEAVVGFLLTALIPVLVFLAARWVLILGCVEPVDWSEKAQIARWVLLVYSVLAFLVWAFSLLATRRKKPDSWRDWAPLYFRFSALFTTAAFVALVANFLAESLLLSATASVFGAWRKWRTLPPDASDQDRNSRRLELLFAPMLLALLALSLVLRSFPLALCLIAWEGARLIFLFAHSLREFKRNLNSHPAGAAPDNPA